MKSDPTAAMFQPFTLGMEVGEGVNAMTQLWQGPAAYWQTVAGIMNLRGRCAQQLWQAQQTALAALPQCQSPADWVGVMGAWQAQNIKCLSTLTCDTQLARMQLLETLQHIQQPPVARATSVAALIAAVPSPVAPLAATVQVPQVFAATLSLPAVQNPAPSAKAVESHSAPAPMMAPPQVQDIFPKPVPATMPEPMPEPMQDDFTLPIMSKTGDSAVFRGSGASLVASAARRSVVARRALRKSRLSRAR